jgi:hypothetical protein
MTEIQPERPKASNELFHSLRDPEGLNLCIDASGIFAIGKTKEPPSRRALLIDPLDAIDAIEKEIGEPFKVTLRRENLDPILVAACLRLRARKLKINTTAPLDVPMIQESWAKVAP